MKLTKKQFYAIYGNNRKMLHGRNYYLIESTHGPEWHTIESHPKLWAKIALTLAMPLVFIIHGLANWREIWDDYLDIIFSKKRGSYSVDKITQKTLDRIKSL